MERFAKISFSLLEKPLTLSDFVTKMLCSTCLVEYYSRILFLFFGMGTGGRWENNLTGGKETCECPALSTFIARFATSTAHPLAECPTEQ